VSKYRNQFMFVKIDSYSLYLLSGLERSPETRETYLKNIEYLKELVITFCNLKHKTPPSNPTFYHVGTSFIKSLDTQKVKSRN